MALVNKFKLGCDPEFVAVGDDGHIVNAETMGIEHDGPVGFDHGGRILEVRPAPANGVLPLIRRMQKLIKDKRLNKKLVAGPYYEDNARLEPLGGHVHFGIKPYAKVKLDRLGAYVPDEMTEEGKIIIKALDQVTKYLEHLDILPTLGSDKRRKNHFGYGRWGDVRDCDGHLEYRTMASWLYDPKVAFLCLTAAKLAAADPVGAYEALKEVGSYAKFADWMDRFYNKDTNAARAVDRVLQLGHKALKVDPSVDFRARWERTGL